MVHPLRAARPLRSRALHGLALACALTTLGFVAIPASRAEAGWWDDLDKGETVTLSDLCAEPVRWRDKVVTFACIYNERAEIFSPYFTSFNAEKYENVTAWLDGSPLWDPEAFERDDFPFLYLPRAHTQRNELFRLPPFTRIEITGKVKDVYRSRPWIEIQAFRVTAATLGRAVIDYVKSGDGYAAQGNYPSAEAHYRRALDEIKLADVYRTRIQKRLAEVLRAAGRGLEANKVEGPSPILGAGGPPLPAGAGAGLPDARTPESPGTPATPPGELTTDLPGEAGGAVSRPPPLLPATTARPTAPAPPVADGGFHPVAPPVSGSVAPPSEITSDLPGTSASAGPPPIPAPAFVPSLPAAPARVPAPPTVAAPSTAANPSPPPLESAAPPIPPLPALPAPPVPALPAPAAPVIAPPVPSAAPVPPSPAPPPAVPESAPPPPPRQPRLSGVK